MLADIAICSICSRGIALQNVARGPRAKNLNLGNLVGKQSAPGYKARGLRTVCVVCG
jgi:hypothetical protein